MQSRNQEIEAFRKTFKLAKTELYNKDSGVNMPLCDDLLSALSLTSKYRLHELAKDVYALLDTANEVIRQTVLETLVFIGSQIPELKETAYKIWLEDEDKNVREAALGAWASCYYNTQNPEALKILYKILMDEKYSVSHRVMAMKEIFFISQEPSRFFDPFDSWHFSMNSKNEILTDHKKFNDMVDWGEIKAIMKKYAPDALS